MSVHPFKRLQELFELMESDIGDVLDSAIPPGTQNDATKKLIWRAINNTLNKCYVLVGTANNETAL